MMLIVLVLFVFGLVWGSFLNVVIYRMTHGTSPWVGRSQCPHCQRQISWKDNIPLISFLVLHGRCANCRKKISWRYPIVELLTGLLFVWWYFVGRGVFLLVENPWQMLQPLFWLTTGMLLLAVFFADLFFEIIPDQLSLVLVLIGLGYRLGLVLSGNMQFNDMLGGVVAGLSLALFFYFLWWITKGRGFGAGDVKLAPALGLILGWQKTVLMFNLAFVLGAIVGVFLLITKRKKRNQTIPFGPFLVLATFICLVWGNQIWNWYFGLL